jgi:hypothetical protein
MALAFTITGFVLTLAGIVCAVLAFVRTWHELLPEHPLVPLPRWPWGKGVVTLHSGSGHAKFNFNASGRGWVSIAETAPVDEQIAYLRRSVLALDCEIGAEAVRSAKRDADLKAQVAQVEAALQQSAVDLRVHMTRVSTGTIRLQLFGIFLVGLGACLGVVPAVFRLT